MTTYLTGKYDALLTSAPCLALQAVIGAGCAGLVSARELSREGHDVKVQHIPSCMSHQALGL